MKIVCESCHAKYQIPDERVAGRKLKIRCKRCGSMVLIHGESVAVDAVAAGDATAAMPTGIEWHVSVEGENFGPFGQPELLSWLTTTPGGWEAYVWRESFSGWIEARTCNELVQAAGGPESLPAPPQIPAEDDGPTRMFEGGATDSSEPDAQPEPVRPVSRPRVSVSPARAAQTPVSQPSLAAAHSSPQLRGASPSRSPASRVSVTPARPSQAPASRSRPNFAASNASPPALRAASEPRLRSPSSAPGVQQAAHASSPRVSAAQAFAGERHEDSVLFSTKNLQQVASRGSQPAAALGLQPPGYAVGEGSGLIDIRALASLARQAPSIPPAMPSMRSAQPLEYSQGEESRVLLQPSGAFNRIDSLAPVATSRASNNALPLAIFGGFGLVAAAAFAAIVLTHRQATPVVAPVASAMQPTAAATALPAQPAAAQPVAELAEPVAIAPTIAEEKAEPEPPVAEPAQPHDAKTADAKTADAKGVANKRRVRGARSTGEEKKTTAPEEKAKDKDKDKASTPPSLDDVMLADKGSDAKPAKAEAAHAKDEPKAETSAKESSGEADDLLGAKPAKQPAKSRSIDELIDGAVEKKVSPAAAVAEDLPESPSRDETLSAMRGVESAVQACANGQEGTANVQIQVAGSTGRVTSANVDGITGPVGSCIARAVRAAKFPRFSKASFAVKFPYRLQ
ncbi:MAG TPA: zinc-ribbon domain-containing protein [Polyangiales bacterium]